MRTMFTVICFVTFTGCAIDETGVPSEDGQAQESGLTATQGPATTADSNAWIACRNTNLTGVCLGGPVRKTYLDYPLYDDVSSIQTNGTAMETWNDENFKGTYGYFAPWGTWLSLSSPYNDEISSISYPGV